MVDHIKVKKCKVCGMEKGLTAFHKNKSSLDGRATQCSVCRRKIDKQSHGSVTWDQIKKPAKKIVLDRAEDREKCLRWHQAREKHQDLMRRDADYPSNYKFKGEYI